MESNWPLVSMVIFLGRRSRDGIPGDDAWRRSRKFVPRRAAAERYHHFDDMEEEVYEGCYDVTFQDDPTEQPSIREDSVMGDYDEELGKSRANDRKHNIDRRIKILLIVVLVILVVALSMLLYAVLRYRAEATDHHDSNPCLYYTDHNAPDPMQQCSCNGQVFFVSDEVKTSFRILSQKLHLKHDDDDGNKTNNPTAVCEPHNMAMLWLASTAAPDDDDDDGNDDPSNGVSLPIEEKRQRWVNRYALAYLYVSFFGQYWRVQTNWLTPVDVCEWYGVECDPNGDITTISLHSNNLQGDWGPDVAEVLGKIGPSLHTLNFHNNDLFGEVALGGMTQLVNIDMAWNHIRGTLPDSLEGFSALKVIDFASNNLSGPLPTSLTKLTQLEELLLMFNDMTGTIPESIGDMTSLKSFGLVDMRIGGTIPTTVGRLTDLENFLLGDLSLVGTVPSQVGLLTELKTLNFFANDITGTLPSSIRNLSLLEVLWFQDSPLTGTVPTQVGFLTSLEKVSFENTELSGTLPTELGNLNNLSFFSVQSCPGIGGAIPSEMARLTQLTYLELDGSSMSGSVPEDFLALTGSIIINKPTSIDCQCCESICRYN